MLSRMIGYRVTNILILLLQRATSDLNDVF